ncbi:concanavalin A-like lectin/glucanase domain-containing protein [Zychaea mexicana]|uniref:concanavalin A-like lectin/glucanase domain-containing protein n=1 Tax=Zychaea mexicana TaxID=64656 RepID=UPI0022FE59D3|nr:concanavalin A-like lectin/glucanase domain-containing protein [Zychaea mexicana]KAI9492747.1 concanavalin A-like lectin/glucanase domain-containing protein [Zychaea mexicana]
MHLGQLIGLSAFLLASTTTFTDASPLINKRAEQDKFCGTEASKQAGNYNVHNNLVGRSESGEQCTEILSTASDNGISWRTTWTWSGQENYIKSFANAAYHFEPKAISEITSIPLAWDWEYTAAPDSGDSEGEEPKSNVMLDLWTYPHSDKIGGYDCEIAIWFDATGGAEPLGNKLVASPYVDTDGTKYDVYAGTNTVQKVFSFVAKSENAGENLEKFNGDVLPFISFLKKEAAYPADLQYLGAIRGGTTAYVGNNVVFTTREFIVQVK